MVKYKKGVDNSNADALSRLHFSTDTVTLEDISLKVSSVRALFPNIYEEELVEDVNDIELTYKYIRALINDQDDAAVKAIADQLSDAELRKCRRDVKKYFTKGETLYRRRSPYPPMKVISKGRRQGLIRALHDQRGHFAVDSVVEALTRFGYWDTMSNDVKDYIRECEGCQYFKPREEVEELHPVAPLEIFKLWSLDFVGPLPSTADGNEYLLVAIDHFSRFPIAKPVPNQSGSAVCKFLMEEIVCNFGPPCAILTDQGTPFVNNQVRNFLGGCNIEHRVSTAYHPESNGLVERYNGVIESSLKKYTLGDERRWDLYVPLVLYSIRVRVQSSVGYSPYFIVYGKEPTTTLDGHVLFESDILSEEEMLLVRQDSTQTLKEAQERIKSYHDSKLKPKEDLKVGDLVLLHDARHHKSKFAPIWLGPYKVAFSTNGTTFVITDADGKVVRSAHRDQLKKFVQHEVPAVRIPKTIMETYLRQINCLDENLSDNQLDDGFNAARESESTTLAEEENVSFFSGDSY